MYETHGFDVEMTLHFTKPNFQKKGNRENHKKKNGDRTGPPIQIWAWTYALGELVHITKYKYTKTLTSKWKIAFTKECSRMKDSSVLKLAHEDSISQDRISALPDEILCHILSFLIPLHSVRTTVLAKRWNNLWTGCVSNLDFNSDNFRSYRNSFSSSRAQHDNHDNLIRFVDRVLALRDSSLDIRRFCVRWWECGDFSTLERWIHAAVDANLVELHVSLSVPCRCGYCEDEPCCVQPFKMPPSVLTCESLVSLKVKGYLSYYLPETETGCYFPNLKFLHYSSRYDSGRASRENLFRSCPKLEELTIKAHYNKHVVGFNISAPELRALTTIIEDGYDDEDEDECDQKNCAGCDAEAWYPCTFSINAPKLEKLCVAGEVMSNYIWENTSSLVQAEVQLQYLRDGFHHEVYNLLKDSNLSSVRYMTISTPDFEPVLFLTFGNLIKLEMVFCCKKFCWAWLKKMLQKSPNLKSLVIEFTSLKPPGWFLSYDFYPPISVPTCLTSQLKTVFLKEFIGTPDEISVVEYLLRYGEVLNKLIVSSSRCSHTGDAKKKIISFEKGSKTCQVDFI